MVIIAGDARDLLRAWRGGAAQLRKAMKTMDAGTAAGAVAEILDRAGWDADYGPVLTEASEEDIARNVTDPADVPWILSQNVLLPIPGLQGGYAVGQESLDLINDIHSDVHGDPPPYESGAPSDSDDQYTLNGYRLGQYFFPEEQDPDDLYLAGIRAFFLAIDAYESVYGILAPWHPVLPHAPRPRRNHHLPDPARHQQRLLVDHRVRSGVLDHGAPDLSGQLPP